MIQCREAGFSSLDSFIVDSDHDGTCRKLEQLNERLIHPFVQGTMETKDRSVLDPVEGVNPFV